jgi:hypothetical protein
MCLCWTRNWSPIPANLLLVRELKLVGRQHGDDGQNKFLQINDNKENLPYIIIRMDLIQYKKLKTLALCGKSSTEPNFKLHLLRLKVQAL